MRRIILTAFFLSLLNAFSYGQQTEELTKGGLQKTAIGFLTWYKERKNHLMTSPLVVGFNQDSIKKDSIVRIDMPAIEEYLSNLKSSNYVSDVFIDNLKRTYISVSDTLIKYPLVDYFGPIPGLESDLIFGFEPEAILDHIKAGRFTKIYTIYNKALVKFDISELNQYIFIMTKVNNKWLIDYFGVDLTNLEVMSHNDGMQKPRIHRHKESY
ncbi:hypothetical protein [Pedobacter gandavensis]|uniref:hypothetical protein n=1 Tax=Pedobacter gandavensis TaxID=2679963 RepID=UPI00292CAFC7|nr:hypothetical protein [Pedobacter gandavensis]